MGKHITPNTSTDSVEQFLSKPFSRRAFLAALASAGMAATLPLGDGKFMRAWADEVGEEHITVYVLNRYELGITVYDVASGDKQTPIAGATVTITSFATGAAETVTTDENGVACMDVRKLAQPVPDESKRERYEFQGYIHVEEADKSKATYRVYEAGRMRFSAPEPVDFPTEPLNGKPYLQLLAFDDYDIQYAKDVSFPLDANNNADHTLRAKIVGDPKQYYKVWFKNSGGVTASMVVQAEDSGIAYPTFAGPWLYLNDSNKNNLFTANSTTTLFFAPSDSAGKIASTTEVTAVTSTLSIKETLVNNESNGETTFELTDLNMQGIQHVPAFQDTKELVSIPQEVPCTLLRGMKLVSWLPSFTPFIFEVNAYPPALLGGIGLSPQLHASKTGSSSADEWKIDTGKTAQEQFAKKFDDYTSAYEKLKTGAINAMNQYQNSGTMPAIKPETTGSKSFDLKVSCGVMIGYMWQEQEDEEENTFTTLQGTAVFKGFLQAAASFDIVEQISFDGIPLGYIEFDGKIEGKLQAEITGLMQPDANRALMPSYFYIPQQASNDTVVSLTIPLEFGIGVGVGMHGVLSVGVRGYIGFKFLWSLGETPPENTSPHHIAFTLSSGLQLVAQFLLFKLTYTIASITDLSLYDNWHGAAALESAPDALGVAGLNSFFNAAVPYTTDELALSVMGTGLVTTENGQNIITNSPQTDTSAGYCTYQRLGLGMADTIKNGWGPLGANASEVCLYAKAFADSRIKTAVVGDRKFICMLGSWTYYGKGSITYNKVRTRLLVAEYDDSLETWGALKPVEFELQDPTNLQRLDSFDYDFEILTNGDRIWADDGAILRVLLVHGPRPQDDSTTATEVASNTMVTFLSLKKYSAQDAIEVVGQHDFVIKNDVWNPEHMIMFPRLAHTDEGTYVTFLVRRASQGNLFSKSNFSNYLWCGYYAAGTLVTSHNYDLTRTAVGKVVVQDIVAAPTSDRINVLFSYFENSETSEKSVFATANIRTTYNQYSKDWSWYWNNSEYAVPTFSSVYPGVICAEPLPNGNFLLCRLDSEGNQRLLEFTTSSGSERDMTPDGFKGGTFKVSKDGSTLFFSNNKHHDDPNNPVSEYQIRAARRISTPSGDIFCPSFVMANVEHPVDQLSYFPYKNDGMQQNVFTFGSFNVSTDNDGNLSVATTDIYGLSVPLVRCVTLLSFASSRRYICKGEDAEFLVTIRNDGNTVISEFKLYVYTMDTHYSKEFTINTGVDALVSDLNDITPSNTNEAAEPGVLQEAPMVFDTPSQAGVCVPGRERTYRMTLSVPSNWNSEQALHAHIVAGSAQVSNVQDYYEAQNIQESALCVYEQGLMDPAPASTTVYSLHFSNDADTLDNAASRYTHTTGFDDDNDGDDSDTDGGGNGGNGGDGGSEGGGTGGGGTHGDTAKTLVSTGDATSGAAVAAAAVAAVGAGVAVSSHIARTHKVEQTANHDED